MNQNKIIEELENTGNYKVLSRYKRSNYYHHDDKSEKLTGIFLDVETTGLSHKTDKIIEIALVPFEFSKDGRIFKVHDSYSSLEDPKVALSEKIIALTGLKDAMLNGKSFDDNAIGEVVESANLILAHNASFDRKFAERRFPVFAEKPWACSQVQVPWDEEGFASTKLEYLAYKFGYFFDGHRAEIDCYASIHLLSKKLPKSKGLVLDILLKNARKNSYQVWALDSDFEKKDLLKNRGYKWFPGGEGRKRSWHIEVDEQNLEPELEYLKKEIYEREINLPIDTITSFNRFSERI
jgi:DNA polymerase III subunit epsilon